MGDLAPRGTGPHPSAVSTPATPSSSDDNVAVIGSTPAPPSGDDSPQRVAGGSSGAGGGAGAGGTGGRALPQRQQQQQQQQQQQSSRRGRPARAASVPAVPITRARSQTQAPRPTSGDRRGEGDGDGGGGMARRGRMRARSVTMDDPTSGARLRPSVVVHKLPELDFRRVSPAHAHSRRRRRSVTGSKPSTPSVRESDAPGTPLARSASANAAHGASSAVESLAAGLASAAAKLQPFKHASAVEAATAVPAAPSPRAAAAIQATSTAFASSSAAATAAVQAVGVGAGTTASSGAASTPGLRGTVGARTGAGGGAGAGAGVSSVVDADGRGRSESGEGVRTYFGMDIGGTQAKLVFFFPDSTAGMYDPVKGFVEGTTTYGTTGTKDQDLRFRSEVLGGTFVFVRYHSVKTPSAIEMIRDENLHRNIDDIYCTGGGAYKYAKLIEEQLAVRFHKSDELETLVKGLVFLLHHSPQECYTLTRAKFGEEPQIHHPQLDDNPYPFLIVNIGSGVSIVKVSSPSTFERVSGTALGGGTMFGLARLLTRASTFDEAMNLAETGDAHNVNQLVRDIYGGDYTKFGLPGSLTASFFGKLATVDSDGDPRAGLKDVDVCRALIVMLSQNITQIAYLNAQLHNTRYVFFTGGFLRNNAIAVRTLTYTMHVWAGTAVEPLFLRHEAYNGAMGAFVDTLISGTALDSPTASPPPSPKPQPQPEPEPEPEQTAAPVAPPPPPPSPPPPTSS